MNGGEYLTCAVSTTPYGQSRICDSLGKGEVTLIYQMISYSRASARRIYTNPRKADCT